MAFLRKDAIARWALESPLTLRENQRSEWSLLFGA